MRRKKVNHQRFDRLNVEFLMEPGQEWPKMPFQAQGRSVLEVMAREVEKSNTKILTGHRLREILEENRREYFSGTQQKEIMRIFQEYRARFERAGLIRVWKGARAGV